MNRRLSRVAASIKEIIAELLVREVKDPRIGMVTLSEVVVSPDLRHARVYFSSLGGERERAQSLAGLHSARGFFRSEIARRLHLRTVPEIVFEIDPSFAEAERVLRLIRDVAPEPENDEE